MSQPVSVTPTKPTGKKLRLYQMYEWEVKFDDPAYFHKSALDENEYHNAYDADENGILFRVDALFEHTKGTVEVPVFAAKNNRTGGWKWLIRFRPHRTGRWALKLFVVHRHLDKQPGGEPKGAEKKIRYDGSDVVVYEHSFGPERVGDTFLVVDQAPYQEGPLESPVKKDNPRYFYRRDNKGKRQPLFLLGFARPWVTWNEDSAWDPYLDRPTELFAPMFKTGCNVLYHWMAPGETHLVHQATDEYWFDKAKHYFKAKEKWPGKKLSGPKEKLAYKRYDQGRAAHTDGILDQAQIKGKNHHLLLMVCPIPHSLLQAGKMEGGRAAGHNWNEWSWSTQHRDRKYNETRDIPCKLNGFHFFKKDATTRISILDFFQMDPGASGSSAWKRRLWKHFAAYWRYVIGRWGAHPALGAWILADELEGVGTSTDWWWRHKRSTYAWHDFIVKLLRGKLPAWGRAGGRDLYYTSDYLDHPLSSSSTHYEGSHPDAYLKRGTSKRRLKERFERSGDTQAALQLIEQFRDLPERGTWRGKPGGQKVDFVSHHAYQAVPCLGQWVTVKATGKRRYLPVARIKSNLAAFTSATKDDLKDCGPAFRWALPNQSCTLRIAADRWLWDTLCMRLRNWTRANLAAASPAGKLERPLLITEFGCAERDEADNRWDYYGKRVSAFTHFGCWSALALGHSGVPFKWNDAKDHGEMAYRTSAGKPSRVWSRANYPVDNYLRIYAVDQFIKSLGAMHVRLDMLHDTLELEVVERVGNRDKPDLLVNTPGFKTSRFNAWALASRSRTVIVAWVYDRSFSSAGKDLKRYLKIRVNRPGEVYDIWRYNTWDALFEKTEYKAVKSDSHKDLRVPLKRFPRAEVDQTVKGVADGNDVALIMVAT